MSQPTLRSSRAHGLALPLALATASIFGCAAQIGDGEDSPSGTTVPAGSSTSSGTGTGGGSADSSGGATSSGGTGSAASNGGGTSVGSGGTSVGTGSSTSTGGTSSTGGAASSAPTDLPCEIQALLANHCQSCHKNAVRGLLFTHADLLLPSKTDPTRSMAEEAQIRTLVGALDPMPPEPDSLTAEEISTFSAWVDAGSPAGSCGMTVDPTPSIYDTPLTCTSATHWTMGNQESPLMHPGGTCIGCHTDEGEGPLLSIAGTVFPTAHEPDDCNGVPRTSGAVVVITDANGQVVELPVNQAGNFYFEDRIQPPYEAKVVANGRERVMVGPQTNGDCNHCHTQDGAEDAPGRIMAP